MDREKIKGYLNIARKAGYLIQGGETLERYTKKLYLVLYDNRSARSTLKIVEKLSLKYPTLKIENLESLTGLQNCLVVGIKNKDLSDIIQNLIKEQ